MSTPHHVWIFGLFIACSFFFFLFFTSLLFLLLGWALLFGFLRCGLAYMRGVVLVLFARVRGEVLGDFGQWMGFRGMAEMRSDVTNIFPC